MQETPFPPGSAWLSGAWSHHFVLDQCMAILSACPGLTAHVAQPCSMQLSLAMLLRVVPQNAAKRIALFSAGHILSTTAMAPTLWTQSFPPTAAIEPVLPDPQRPTDPVGYKQVFASETQVGRP